MYNNYRAFIIKQGDTIEFKNNTIILKQQSPVFSNDKCINKIQILK